MFNDLVTPFWQKAALSLAEPYRSRYMRHFVAAERRERALDLVIRLLRRPRSASSSSSS
jgi:hypothetical protein